MDCGPARPRPPLHIGWEDDRSQTLEPARLDRTFAKHWKALGLSSLPRSHARAERKREWLLAYRSLQAAFGDDSGFAAFAPTAAGWATDLEQFDAQVSSFQAFASAFSQTLGTRELLRLRPQIGSRLRADGPGWSACREGHSFLENFGPAAYKDQVQVFCNSAYPSTWTYRAGRSDEESVEVPVSACVSYFAAPGGCD